MPRLIPVFLVVILIVSFLSEERFVAKFTLQVEQVKELMTSEQLILLPVLKSTNKKAGCNQKLIVNYKIASKSNKAHSFIPTETELSEVMVNVSQKDLSVRKMTSVSRKCFSDAFSPQGRRTVRKRSRYVNAEKLDARDTTRFDSNFNAATKAEEISSWG